MSDMATRAGRARAIREVGNAELPLPPKVDVVEFFRDRVPGYRQTPNDPSRVEQFFSAQLSNFNPYAADKVRLTVVSDDLETRQEARTIDSSFFRLCLVTGIGSLSLDDAQMREWGIQEDERVVIQIIDRDGRVGSPTEPISPKKSGREWDRPPVRLSDEVSPALRGLDSFGSARSGRARALTGTLNDVPAGAYGSDAQVDLDVGDKRPQTALNLRLSHMLD